MSGSRPIPTPVPAGETLAQWEERCGASWRTREDDRKLFAKRPAQRLIQPPVPGEDGTGECERTIRAIERQINGGRNLSPTFQPKRRVYYHVPEPVSGAASAEQPITRASTGEPSGETREEGQ